MHHLQGHLQVVRGQVFVQKQELRCDSATPLVIEPVEHRAAVILLGVDEVAGYRGMRIHEVFSNFAFASFHH
jgi:hypothetical protein